MEYKIINWHKMNSIVTVPNAQGDYLFYDQLKQVRERCEEIVKGKDILQHETILGVVGDRGSGKSSFLHTVKENLSNEYCVLDIVDPSIFNNSMSIIELFVSQIYKRITDDKSDEFDSNTYCRDKIFEQLNSITKVLSDFRAGEKEFYENNTYGEVLTNVRQRGNLPELIKELIDRFLSYYCNGTNKHKGIILCIDDVDLVSNQQIFNLLEDVRKYLAGNIIVITAFHFRQLFDAILHVKIKENDALLGKDVLDVSDVREQATRYLEKLVPVQNRIELPIITNLLTEPYKKLMEGLVADSYVLADKHTELNNFLREQKLPYDSNDKLIMSDWLYAALNARLRLKLRPVDKREDTPCNLPQNLRGLLQLVRLIIDDMKIVDLDSEAYKDKSKRDKIASNIIGNLQIYDNYLRRNYQELLSGELGYILEGWKNTNYHAKNYFICDELFKMIEKVNKEVLVSLPKYYLIKSDNVTIGDVFNILEIYKSIAPTAQKTLYFIYLLKVLYSIKLLENYLSASEGETESLEIYLTLINAKLLPEDFIYFQTYTINANAAQFDKKLVDEDYKLRELYHKLLYSTVASDSDYRRAIPKYTYYDIDRKTSRPLSKTKQYDTLKFQRLYDYNIDNLDAFVSGFSYPIDPLAFVGQKWYVEETFSENKYVFYSMFDLDAFVRFDYGRANRVHYELLERLLSKIDDILTISIGEKSQKNIRELQLAESMSSPVFCKDNMRFERKSVFFSDNDRTFIQGLYRSEEVVISVDELPKYNFVELLNDILSNIGLDLQTDEREALNEINSRLSMIRTRVRDWDRVYVQNIIIKYRYGINKK